MRIRERILPPGWYPGEGRRVSAFLEALPPGKGKRGAEKTLAALAPHAGWTYGGTIAAAALGSLGNPGAPEDRPDTVAVIGGHLPPGMPPLFALEDGADTPLGPLMIDGELRDRLMRELDGKEDRYGDNTVEVLLPMVRYFFPGARLLWLRLPAELASFRAGALLSRTAADLGRKIAVLGSTDLTHYGDNYGFSPQGRGRKALEWVREVNDRAFINALLAGKAEEALDRAETDRAACSAGAALGTLGFALDRGAERGELLAYGTSADGQRETPPSFVGYAALSWSRG